METSVSEIARHAVKMSTETDVRAYKMIHRVFKAVANSTFERECPYEGRQRFFFGVGGSGRRPVSPPTPEGSGVRGVNRAPF